MATADRREREFRQREAALLAAAAELFEAEDWQAVTVDAIAARAEYAKGTVYIHFASKDEIYARLVTAWAEEMHAELNELDAGRPFEAVLRDFVAVIWRYLAGSGLRARLGQFVRRTDFLAGLPEATRAALAEADARNLALLEGLIDLGVADGALPEGPLAPRLFAVQALLSGATRLHPLWQEVRALAAPEEAVAEAALAILRAPAPAVAQA
jgi:AcrR family transcriptional regulator